MWEEDEYRQKDGVGAKRSLEDDATAEAPQTGCYPVSYKILGCFSETKEQNCKSYSQSNCREENDTNDT